MFTVPAKWYPWALLFFWQLLMPGVSFLGHLGGVLAGQAYVWGWLRWLTLSTTAYQVLLFIRSHCHLSLVLLHASPMQRMRCVAAGFLWQPVQGGIAGPCSFAPILELTNPLVILGVSAPCMCCHLYSYYVGVVKDFLFVMAETSQPLAAAITGDLRTLEFERHACHAPRRRTGGGGWTGAGGGTATSRTRGRGATPRACSCRPATTPACRQTLAWPARSGGRPRGCRAPGRLHPAASAPATAAWKLRGSQQGSRAAARGDLGSPGARPSREGATH